MAAAVNAVVGYPMGTRVIGWLRLDMGRLSLAG